MVFNFPQENSKRPPDEINIYNYKEKEKTNYTVIKVSLL